MRRSWIGPGCVAAMTLVLAGARVAPAEPPGLVASLKPAIPDPDSRDMPLPLAQRLADVRAEVLAQPASVAAWSRLGGVCDAHQLFDCAATAYRQAQALAPADFRWPYLEGLVLLRSRAETAEAETLLRKTVQLAPAYAPARLNLGLILVRQGKRQEALEEYRLAVEINPDMAVAHRSLGQLLLAMGNAKEAIRSLERAARLSPNDGGALAALAQAYGRAGEREKARAAAEQARGRQPVHLIEDPVRAAVLAEAVRMDTLQSRAAGHFRNREYDKAIPLLQLMDDVRPNDPQVLSLLGRAHRMTGRPDRAEKYLSAALRAKPDMVEVRLGLTSLFIEQERFDEAIDHYKLAVEHAPDRAPLRLKLGGLLLEHGRFKEAAEEFRQAANLAPPDVDTKQSFGEALLGSDDFAGAAAQLRDVVKADPQNAEAHFLLAQAYEGLGDKSQANVHYRKAEQLSRQRESANRP